MERSHNIAEVLYRNRADGRGNRVALCCGDARLTYGELAGLAERAGLFLGSLGVERENRVALLLYDSPEFVAAFYGAAAVGAIPVPLNTTLPAADYEYMLSHCRAKVLIVSGALYGAVAPILSRCPSLKHTAVVGEQEPRGTSNWQKGLDEASGGPIVVDAGPDEPAFWLYSSGSGGRPKAVVHAHRSVWGACRSYGEETLGLTSEDVCFSAAKLFHAYGLGNSMNFPIAAGATTVLWPGPPMPETLYEIIARHRPTVFFATPALFVGMLALAEGGKMFDLSSIRFCVSAGEALPAATFTRWKEKFGLEILDGIGSTEMLHIFISNRMGEARAGSSGKPVSGYEVKLVDENEEAVPAGELGDLWVSGESSAAMYWNDRARTHATMRGKWVVTGDKYRQDEEGFFWFQGRTDDMLKVNGIWVSPPELEHILNEHPAVAESAVVGVRDQDGLVQVKAFVVLRPGQEASAGFAKQLRAFVKQQAPQRYPRLFEFVPSLPKTATGKIKRFKLRETEAAA